MTTYKPSAGEHIEQACHNAAQQAQTRGKNVSFVFNGITMVATPKSDPRKLLAKWNQRMESERKQPPSPEWVLAERRIEEKIQQAQETVNSLCVRLPDALSHKSLDALMCWMTAFVGCGDWSKVDYHNVEILDALRGAGYGGKDYHNREPQWYCTRERIGNWVVCEVMNQLESGMPPYPAMSKFCEKYFELEPQEAASQ